MNTSKYVNPVTKVARQLLNLKLKRCGAVIVAAGSATRMGGLDKILEDVAGEPMICRTVRAFEACDAVSEIVIVTRSELIPRVSSLCAGFEKVKMVVAGGKDRAESVHLGMNALSDKVKLAAIHDGARPLVTWQLIDRVVRAANSFGAAVPAVPVKDTIKVTNGGIVKTTPDRKTLCAVQTPQVFDFDMLRGALKKVRMDGTAITDDSSAIEMMGMSVKVVEGDERNIKVTTPMDLAIVRLLAEENA